MNIKPESQIFYRPPRNTHRGRKSYIKLIKDLDRGENDVEERKEKDQSKKSYTKISPINRDETKFYQIRQRVSFRQKFRIVRTHQHFDFGYQFLALYEF